jgi:acetate kinase
MKEQTIAVLNAGSSSLKFALYRLEEGALHRLYHGQIAGIAVQGRFTVCDANGMLLDEASDAADHAAALQRLLQWLDSHNELELQAVGHRVVHGGVEFSAPVVVDDLIMARLQLLIPLAPLHQPHNLKAIELLRQLRPALPQIACFDTAFHRTMPMTAQRYALPHELFDKGVRAYGFHGLSYEYIATQFPSGRVIVAHLGNGASMCALRDGKSVATTMGFTPLDGLPMGTRCGAIDPGVLIYLLRHGMSVDELDDLLQHQSGLLGLSAISSDMRTLLESSDDHAAEAIEQFCYRTAREIGSLAAALAGLDAIVFTAGIGEHAAEVRSRICQQTQWLGVQLDETANRNHSACISTPQSTVSIWVMATDEEQVIARHCHSLVAQS